MSIEQFEDKVRQLLIKKHKVPKDRAEYLISTANSTIVMAFSKGRQAEAVALAISDFA